MQNFKQKDLIVFNVVVVLRLSTIMRNFMLYTLFATLDMKPQYIFLSGKLCSWWKLVRWRVGLAWLSGLSD